MPTKPNNGEYLTQLPTTAQANLTDIIYAVQGYNPPNSQGLAVQQTLGQVHTLFQTTITLSSVGNPNGNLAGTIYQYCWDSLNHILYICTSPGTAATAIWEKVITLTGGSGITITQSGDIIEISSSASGMTWTDVTSTSQTMVTNNAYQANNASLVSLTLPIASSFGDSLWISGLGSGGWTIVQNANQQIIVGNQQTTVGNSGSLSSTNQYDGIELYCVVPNLVWKNVAGPQGCLTYV